MDREELLNIIATIIEDVTDIPKDEIHPEDSVLEDLDLSSLEVLAIVSRLSKQLSVSINSNELMKVQTIDDLEEGMILPGIVTNITNFGAFVDIGVHQDGLVHISQMANRRIAHPTDVVKLHQHVTVRVIEIDHRRHRISLSMKQ